MGQLASISAVFVDEIPLRLGPGALVRLPSISGARCAIFGAGASFVPTMHYGQIGRHDFGNRCRIKFFGNLDAIKDLICMSVYQDSTLGRQGRSL